MQRKPGRLGLVQTRCPCPALVDSGPCWARAPLHHASGPLLTGCGLDLSSLRTSSSGPCRKEEETPRTGFREGPSLFVPE